MVQNVSEVNNFTQFSEEKLDSKLDFPNGRLLLFLKVQTGSQTPFFIPFELSPGQSPAPSKEIKYLGKKKRKKILAEKDQWFEMD